MAKEIERKFLVAHEAWRENIAEVHVFRQGYLNYDSLRTVRVRASEVTGYLTIKGITEGLTRDEFEYEIPLSDALAYYNCANTRLLRKSATSFQTAHTSGRWMFSRGQTTDWL